MRTDWNEMEIFLYEYCWNHLSVNNHFMLINYITVMIKVCSEDSY
jgi:hypothetical protein